MRNYMFDRLASGAPAQTQPQPGPQAGRPAVYTPVYSAVRPRRRSPLPWIIAFVVLIVSLAVTAVILNYAESSRWYSAGNDPAEFPFDLPNGFYQPQGTSETTIARAPTGDGTVLTIQTEEGEGLTAGQVYEKALPSVVSIQASSEAGTAAGSGIIMTGDGYILTNYHVIEGASTAWVFPLTGRSGYQAELVGYAAELDLAVLKVDAKGLTPAEFGSSRVLAVGDTVYALGNPMGYLYGSLTEGIVSALGRSVTIGGHKMSLIQTSAPLNSGNSGGALLNERGQVVGITSAKITSSTDVVAEGLGLAIPISEVRGCVNSILACGEVVTPRIGIMCVAARIDGVDGILVDSVEEDGPALTAGLLAGDLITAANGIPVAAVEELKDVFYDVGVGSVVDLTVLREGETLILSMELEQSK